MISLGKVPFFQAHPDAFQLVIYHDGVDAARLQGSKSGHHEMGHFVFEILNLPPDIGSIGVGLFPIVLANSDDCNGDFSAVLDPLVNQIIELKQGVRAFIGGQFTLLFGTLVGVKGDSKAVDEIFGRLGAGARHFCAFLCRFAWR